MTGPASDAAPAPVRRPRADTARTADLTSWDAPGWAGLRVVVTGLGVTGFSVADTLAELGATVHLAHPLGVKMFGLRRVKNEALAHFA